MDNIKDNIKKIAKKLCVSVILAAVLVSCGGPELLGVIPVYNGAPVTDTNHEFNAEDFIVLASYADGTDEQITDFDIEVEGMQEGYYVVNIKYKNQENECYIPLELDIYPSDHEG